MTMSVATPTDMLTDAVAGPVIRGYLHSLVDGWRKTGASMVRASDYGVVYQVYSHSPTVTSVVFHEYWQTVGNLANNAYRTFTFDHARGTQLQLADLMAPAVLTPLARPYVSDALDQAPPPHDPNTYPFTIDNWEPQADGSGYSSNYRAFALTSDELILYMPDAPMAHENPTPRERFVWSMDGGAVTVHVPLTALGSALRAG
jgi:Protein of unknown function (DUF3298)